MVRLSKVKLMNSAVMTKEGKYMCCKISKEEFGTLLKNAREIESYIGYPANAEYIEREFGVKVPVNRSIAEYEDGDVFLVMKLKYRIPDPSKKKDWLPSDEDYEFLVFTYHKFEEVKCDES